MLKIVNRNCAGIDVHKKTIIAIARLLLTNVYHILLTGEVFDFRIQHYFAEYLITVYYFKELFIL